FFWISAFIMSVEIQVEFALHVFDISTRYIGTGTKVLAKRIALLLLIGGAKRFVSIQDSRFFDHSKHLKPTQGVPVLDDEWFLRSYLQDGMRSGGSARQVVTESRIEKTS